MVKICKNFLISGKVQGVFFRDYTCRKAKELHITGWVRNLPDGHVEVLACGELNQLNDLEAWLWQGSPSAQVSNVTAKDCIWEHYSSFMVR